MIPRTSAFWPLLDIASLALFFAALAPLALAARQRRFGLLLLGLPPLAACWFIEQCAVMTAWDSTRAPVSRAIQNGFHALPPAVPVVALAAALAWIICLLIYEYRLERGRITAMSVKEAVDSLPSGVCAYLPGGRIVLVNRAMERFCLQATGEMLTSGEAFRELLFHGALRPGCARVPVGGTTVLTLPDGTAWSVAEYEMPCQRTTIRRLLVSEVTEAYQKLLSLQQMEEKLSALNARLTTYNREIVALTAERELLDARVRLHDQMGEDLLTMKRFILQGGTGAEREAIEAMLRRNVTFIKTGQQGAKRDEYALMLETAEKLGVRVRVEGALPQTEPQKHIIATGIHECFTNTLRHAHGDALTVKIAESDGRFTVSFSNNGAQPAGQVHEKGGLAALRALAERAGGSLTITSAPGFSVILTLPKEVPHGLQSIDCG